MKIALIGPGIMEIPPPRWGAVEMVIWDNYNILKEFGYQVDIINTPNHQTIVDTVNSNNYDVIHLHYDVFAFLMPYLKAKVKILSSHYPFIEKKEQYSVDGYDKIINHIINNKDFYLFASSQKDINTFVSYGADETNTFLCRLGVKCDSYDYNSNDLYDKTLCFSQIVDRKRQFKIQHIDGIDFVGRLDDLKFVNKKTYLGEFDRNILNKEITKYTNFILLSKTENTTPLVVKEALICGLGLVVTEPVAYELDLSKPYISIIPEDKINDKQYIEDTINQNKNISKNMRDEIRNYGISKFDIKNILLNEYLPKIKQLMEMCR